MLASVFRLLSELDEHKRNAQKMGSDVDAHYVGDSGAAEELVRLEWAESSSPGYIRLAHDHEGLARAMRTCAELRRAPVTRALTIWQPWAWAIATGHKRIENRPWRSKAALGTWIAIHAGLSVDRHAIPKVREITGVEPDVKRNGGIVGIAKLVEVVDSGLPADGLSHRDRKWFTGPYGWRFESAIELDEVIPCRGYQSLWYLPEATAKHLAEVLCA